MRQTKRTGLSVLFFLLAACGTRPGDPAAGETLFKSEIAQDVPTCISCHAIAPGEEAEVMGNNLSNVGNRAATTVRGQTAEEYLNTSIVDPDMYLAADFQEGIHPRTYRKLLTDQQINDLIAYMLTLRSGDDR